MKTNSSAELPLDVYGETANVMIDAVAKKIWVCVEGQCVFRARVDVVTLDDQRLKAFKKQDDNKG